MKPDTCYCCKPPTGATPVIIDNRPGLSAIAYRVGTFANFRQAMFQAISRSAELHDLSTRQSDDYAITIIELWAAIADILTFYQERTANEAFLRTAGLRDSVLRMARMIGYELAPGSAATALLSFTAEKGKQVQVPVGLRVQSVPQQDEKPQKFETLETIAVSDWLNEQAIFPAPMGINPLAKGTTAAYLTAGEDGLAIAENLVAGDRILLFNPSAGDPIEEIIIGGIETDHEHLLVHFTESIQKDTWNMETVAYKLVRSFRVFGYNAPPRYSDVELNEDGSVRLWKYFDIDQSGTPGSNSYALSGSTELHLDSLYDDLKVGAYLLLTEGLSQQRILTVTAVDQEEDQIGMLSDTVTRVTVMPEFSKIDDRRKVVIYELVGPPIQFWGFSYPEIINSATMLIPGRRIGADSIEIARPIAKNAYKDGYTVKLTDIETGRRVILKDETNELITAKIKHAYITGSEIDFDVTAEDVETVNLLSLDRGSARTVTALCSASLEVPLQFSHPSPLSLSVTIGSIGPRTITLELPSYVATELESFAKRLKRALQSADTDPVFAEALVLALDNRLVVVPGDLESAIRFSKTSDDETTIVELGLDEDHARTLSGLLSGELGPVPPYTKASPQLSVRIGPLESRIIDLDSSESSIDLAPSESPIDRIASDLESKLNNADIAPFFKYARVVAADNRLLVFPGMIGAARQDYMKIELSTDRLMALHRQSAVLLGNVALASHGETIESEVLGDADPAIPFQQFILKKSPVTFVPSSKEGGADNSLQLFVNDVLWKGVDSLYDKGPTDTVYRAQVNNDAEMSVRFGDGVTGARPLKGRSNVVARYRQGLGLAGRVKAGALKTLLDKPKGLKSVINPADAEGGADPETLENARRNAPSTVRTFNRAVSLLDLEDLARSRCEVAKAKVTWVWGGESRVAHLTLAGQNGGTFSVTALARIHASITSMRDPNRQLLLDNYRTVPILVTAKLNIEATYLADRVAEAARSALLIALSFESLEFAQSVHLSDVYAILQNVSGVAAVDIDLFMFKQTAGITDTDFARFLADRGIKRAPDGAPRPVQNHLWILPARPNTVSNEPAVFPAEQAWIESPSQDITIVTKGGLSK